MSSADPTTAKSGHINCIAMIKAKPGHEAEIRKILEDLVPAARKENGCTSYHLHVDRTDPRSFFTYEEWASQAALDAHLAGVKGLVDKVQPIVDDLKIIALDHLV